MIVSGDVLGIVLLFVLVVVLDIASLRWGADSRTLDPRAQA